MVIPFDDAIPLGERAEVPPLAEEFQDEEFSWWRWHQSDEWRNPDNSWYVRRLSFQFNREDLLRGKSPFYPDPYANDGAQQEYQEMRAQLVESLSTDLSNAIDEAIELGNRSKELREIRTLASLSQHVPVKTRIAEEVIDTLLFLCRWRHDRPYRAARCKGTEFIPQLGKRLELFLDSHFWGIEARIRVGQINTTPENRNIIEAAAERFGHHAGRLNYEKVAYNITLLLMEKMWIRTKKGEYTDLVDIVDDEDTIDSHYYYPNMLVLHHKIYREIYGDDPEERPPLHSHPIFIGGATARQKMFMLSEPEDHVWNEKIPEIIEIENPTLEQRFSIEKGLEEGGITRGGYLTSTDREFEHLEESPHLVLREFLTNNVEYDAIGYSRAAPNQQTVLALNNLQKTQWSINRDFLNSIIEYQDGRIVLRDGIKIPTNPSSRRDWDAVLHWVRVWLSNPIMGNVFWHSWTCDFRGRLQPRCTLLSPQKADLDRALLLFKEWKPLGDKGWYWLCVHAYNFLAKRGLEGRIHPHRQHASFDDRASWIQQAQNLDAIIRIVTNPIEYQDEWQDEPGPKGESLSRLAAMLELARIHQIHQNDGIPYSEITSGLPIRLDATVNGYQHVSALLRNRRLAQSVNIIPSDQVENQPPVQDLYQRVADIALHNFQQGTSSLAEYFEQYPCDLEDDTLHALFSRNVAKMPTMTSAYGAQELVDCFMARGGKNKKGWIPRYHALYHEENNEFVCHRTNQSFQTLDQLETHVITELRGGRWAEIELHNSADEPPPSNQNSRLTYDENDPLNTRWERHISDLNRNDNGSYGWHPSSLLFRILGPDIHANQFDDDKAFEDAARSQLEFSALQQIQIARCLQVDYIAAIGEATEGCFTTVLDELTNAVNNQPNNLVCWSAPLTNFRVRNINVISDKCKPRWSANHNPPFNNYFPAETIHIEDIISQLDELGLPIIEQMDAVVRRALQTRDSGTMSNDNLFDLFHLFSIPSNEHNQLLNTPYSGLYDFDHIDYQLRRTVFATKWVKNLILPKMVEELPTAFHPNSPFFAEQGVNYEQLQNILQTLKTAHRTLIASKSFNPPRKTERNLDMGKMRRMIAPCFIQSFDAAHMTMTINRMFEHEEIRDFYAVHDCFGVHASDVTLLIETVRRTFFDLHSERDLSQWLDILNPGHGFEPNEDQETFDMEEILQSEYMIG